MRPKVTSKGDLALGLNAGLLIASARSELDSPAGPAVLLAARRARFSLSSPAGTAGGWIPPAPAQLNSTSARVLSARKRQLQPFYELVDADGRGLAAQLYSSSTDT